MISFQKISIHAIFFYCFAVLCIAPFTAHASSLNIRIHDSMINIHAENVSLINILKALSEKTGLSIQSRDPMTEPVTCDLNDITFENSIKHLLKNKNYVLTYIKNEGDQIIPVELRILGDCALKSVNNFGTVPDGAAPEEDPTKRYKRDWFEKKFEDGKKLLQQISVKTVNNNLAQRGFRIVKLQENSTFRDIGLREGDIIANVNGLAVETAEEFIKKLKSLSTNGNPLLSHIIRIERLNSDGSLDPLYIELN